MVRGEIKAFSPARGEDEERMRLRGAECDLSRDCGLGRWEEDEEEDEGG